MSEPLKQKIEELNSKLNYFKEKCDRLNLEAKEWAEKRNFIHEQIKTLRAKVAGLKEKRDALNERVRELKDLREQARAERREKRNQILELREKARCLAEKRVLRNVHDVESKIKRLEWKIQTTSLSVHEEKLLVDQVRALEIQLSTQKQVQKLKENILELQAEEKALETKARLYHERLSELAQQSQNLHEKMTEALSEVDALRFEADEMHQKYVEIKQQAQVPHQKYAELLRQVKSLKQELRQAEEEKRLKRQRELRKDFVEKALEKLKRGERLAWEEFKILAEQQKKVKSLKKLAKSD